MNSITKYFLFVHKRWVVIPEWLQLIVFIILSFVFITIFGWESGKICAGIVFLWLIL